MDISIVLPALNEANKIRSDVEAAAAFIVEQKKQGEVIVVDDGSSDGTAEAARKAGIHPAVKREVIRLKKNTGKGFAVKTGILASQGDIVLFADSGTCVPYGDALPQIKRILAGEVDIAMASRRLKGSVIRRNRSLKRRVLSRFFRLAAIVLTGVPPRFSDTQCGFKLYKGEVARELFAECLTKGYLFELEILVRALGKGYRVEEFPVEWTCDRDTRLKPGSDALGVARDLFRVRKISRGKD
jgi:dolichyl-phosphate beta-glucosyltransferase